MEELKEYAKKVQVMRDAQKTYFKNRTTSNLINSKELEKKIDRLTSDILAQGELFPEEGKEVQND